MDEIKFRNIIDKIDSKVCGVNEESIIEYSHILDEQPIDFKLISKEWLISNIIVDYIGEADIDEEVKNNLVSEEYFEMIFAKEYGVVNPLIYFYTTEAAKKVTSKLVTKESRIAYLNRLLEETTKEFNEATDEKIIRHLQERIDYINNTLYDLNIKQY